MSTTPPNILFLCADDLRPKNLGCYGDDFAITPNFDRLAAGGMVFERAYCHQSLCGPSRAAVMTGRRLDGSNALVESPDYRRALPDVVTIPQMFKQAGYFCASFGKVNHLHPYVLDPESWTIPEQVYDVKKRDEYLRPENRLRGFIHPMSYGTASEGVETPDDGYQDGQAVTAALEKLHEVKDRPFFLGVGFKRPHLPFSCPQKYWDLYDPAKIPDTEEPTLPPATEEELRRRYLSNHVEFRHYTDMPKSGPIAGEDARRLRHAYYACVSYVDAQVGRLLDELRRLDLEKNTIVVFWADHGLHLGESGLWGKKTNTELDLRVPLLISAPGRTHPGTRSRRLVELIDLFPTLAELGDLTPPAGLPGRSLVPLFAAPDQPWKNVAFSQCRDGSGRDVWGCTVRTETHRYVEWFPAGKPDQIVDRELYEIETDPLERNNLAGQPESQNLINELSARIRVEGWNECVLERRTL